MANFNDGIKTNYSSRCAVLSYRPPRSFGENATRTQHTSRGRATALADLEPPKRLGLGLNMGRGWSGPMCKIEIDHKQRRGFCCLPVLSCSLCIYWEGCTYGVANKYGGTDCCTNTVLYIMLWLVQKSTWGLCPRVLPVHKKSHTSLFRPNTTEHTQHRPTAADESTCAGAE